MVAIVGMGTAVSSTSAQAEAQWFVQTAGVSHHFEPSQAKGRTWNESHPGLGVERRESTDGVWSLRYTAGVMQDSRSFWSGYAGAAELREWRWGRNLQIGAGAGVYLFYRSVSWDGTMAVVPALLPTVSIGLVENRAAINFLYVPKVSAYSRAMPPVLYAQFAMKF